MIDIIPLPLALQSLEEGEVLVSSLEGEWEEGWVPSLARALKSYSQCGYRFNCVFYLKFKEKLQFYSKTLMKASNEHQNKVKIRIDS